MVASGYLYVIFNMQISRMKASGVYCCLQSHLLGNLSPLICTCRTNSIRPPNLQRPELHFCYSKDVDVEEGNKNLIKQYSQTLYYSTYS